MKEKLFLFTMYNRIPLFQKEFFHFFNSMSSVSPSHRFLWYTTTAFLCNLEKKNFIMLRLSRINDVVNLLYTESNNLEVYLKKKKFIRQNLHWSGRLKMKLSCMWPMMINDFSTTPPHCPRIELTESNHILH